MNEDQKLIAFLGILLLIVTVATTYRQYLSAIFFGPSVPLDGSNTVAAGSPGSYSAGAAGEYGPNGSVQANPTRSDGPAPQLGILGPGGTKPL